MRTTITWTLTLVVLAALIGGYWFSTGGRTGPGTGPAATPAAGAGPRQMPPMPVEARPAETGTVSETIEAVGSLRSDESVLIKVEAAGRVDRIHFTEGTRIERGALLVTLEDSIEMAQLEQAKASLALSRTNYERTQELVRANAGTTKARDEAAAKLKMDEASVALAQAVVNKMKVYAPQTGILGLRQVSVGDFLAVGAPIVNVERLDPIKVDFRVPEIFAPAVKRGQSIRIAVDALPGQAFVGEVIAIDPKIDINGRNMVVRASLPNPGGDLLPGMFARVTLSLAKRTQAVLIPEEAILPGNPPAIFKVVEGKAVRTPVTLGERQGAMVEIVKGVAPGDVIITAGQMKIGPGAPVMPLPATAAAKE